MHKLAKIVLFLRQAEAARHYYQTGRVALYARLWRLLRSEFSPREIFLWGLLDPAIDDENLKRFISKESFLKFQAATSPITHACLLEDKEVFYRYCESIDLPIPETIAFLSNKSVWLPGGKLTGPGPTGPP